jgi:RHS repeat-associated protein
MRANNLKKVVFAAVVCIIPQLLNAQTATQNFIKKTTPVSRVTTEISLNALTSSYKIESVSYFDGLGRTLQDVLVKGSAVGNDIIQPYYYDQYGRQSIQFLPYTSSTASGAYRDQAYDAQPVFYTNQSLVAKTPYPYAEMVFDGSPLNNVLEKSAPDTDWQLGNGHTTKTVNSANNDYEVFNWQIQSNGDVQPVQDIFYNGNTLNSLKLTDPNGNYSYIYTDKTGKTICTKQFLEMRTVGQLQIPYYLTTYMIYDDFGQLVMVIPPKAMDVMDASGNYSINNLTASQDLVFKYVYDERHRLIEKKVPGTGWNYIVYNQLNQPVLFRDANLTAQNKWSFIKYDVLGRPIMSGLFNSIGLANYQTRTLAQAQLNLNQAAIGESEVPLDVSNPYGYTNVTLPNSSGALDILTVNYYDDYDFDNNGSADYTFNASSIPCLLVPSGGRGFQCLPYTNVVGSRARGYLTGSRIKVLDPACPIQWEIAAVFYDDDGQAIQSQSNDHMGGTDLINMVYDFTGNVIHTQQLHTLTGQNNVQVLNHMYYDKMGRLLQVEQKNNSDAAIILAEYNYNELSQVVAKNVHKISTSEMSTGFLQSMDYRYNIHGELSSINNIDLNDDMTSNPMNGANDDTNDLWGMQLNYNTNTTGVNGTKQYAGNVAEKKWRSITDNVKRAYGYNYDKADRLKQSAYVEYNTVATLWNSNAGKFDEKDIAYDANGNILTLKRYGCQTTGISFGLIDNLTYQYNGNFLGSVTDASATQGYLADFKDNGSTINNEYTYDANGNVNTNPNKKITSIVYNHLNLPTQINFSGTGINKIEYTYDAVGTRLTKKVTQNTSNINIRNYAGIFEYNMANAQPLEFMHNNEGRCVPTNASGTLVFRYEYQYTDNTGNVVMAFTDLDANGAINPATEIIQESNYYSFGMRMEGLANANTGSKYKFGGKELNDDLGLNEYDFGARFYDPATARWGCIDPMADAAPNWTPFRYGFNNPVVVTDPTGMFEYLDPNAPTQDAPQNAVADEVNRTAMDATSSGTVNPLDGRGGTFIPVTGGPVFNYSGTIPSIPLGSHPLTSAASAPNISLPAIQDIPQAPRDQLRAVEPGFWDNVSSAAAYSSAMGKPELSIAYNAVNDAYISYNWIVHRQMADLTGKNIGITKTINTSVLTVMTSASGFIGRWISGLNVIAAEVSSSRSWIMGMNKSSLNTMVPGKYAVESVPGNATRNFSTIRTRLNAIGEQYGCHTCGTKTSNGIYIPDHQPPLKINPNGPFELFPHCPSCSKLQGGQITTFLKN